MKKSKKNKFKSDFEEKDSDLYSEADINTDADRPKPLTREERKMIRASKRKGIDRSKLDPFDKSDLAEAKRYVKKNKFKVAFVAITIILLLAVLISIAAVLIIKLKSGPSKANYEVTVGDDEPYILKYKEANEYGQFFFDLCVIEKYCQSELIASGDNENMTFTCEDGTYVRLSHGSSTATVNGTPVKVGGQVRIIPATDKEDIKCLVPFKFIIKLFSHKADGHPSVGMYVGVTDKNKVTIHRKSYNDKDFLPPITFSADCFEYSDDVKLESYPTSDIDKETAAALCVSKLTLVNKSHPLSRDEISAEKLVSLSELGCPTTDDLGDYDNKDFFDPIAALALIAMINKANKTLEGDDKILVSSAYRSYSYQKGLHNRYIDNYMAEFDVSEEEAEKQTLLTSAPAGKSEHHTGLAVDLVEKRSENRELDESFEDTEAFKWLSKNAHKYGFILRYPKDKTDITKYSYEPWHFRFVGVYAATIIYEDGITLEEFLADTK